MEKLEIKALIWRVEAKDFVESSTARVVGGGGGAGQREMINC